MEPMVQKYLLEQNIRANYKGFLYLTVAIVLQIQYYIQKPIRLRPLMQLYREVGARFGVTHHCVDGCIKKVLDVSLKNHVENGIFIKNATRFLYQQITSKVQKD